MGADAESTAPTIAPLLNRLIQNINQADAASEDIAEAQHLLAQAEAFAAAMTAENIADALTQLMVAYSFCRTAAMSVGGSRKIALAAGLCQSALTFLANRDGVNLAQLGAAYYAPDLLRE